MSPKLERALYLLVLVALSAFLLYEGRTQAALASQIALEPEALYQRMARSHQPLQIIDVRPLSDEDDADVGGYEETHIPGALPFPSCDPARAPEAALARISSYLPTVIISRDGNPAQLEACTRQFRLIQNVSGGMSAWMDRGYPEDSGEYVAPPAGSGGGCL